MTASSPPFLPRKTKFVAQKPGDECKRCAKFWRVRDKSPQIIVELGKGDYGTPIAACPWCDGPVVEMHLQRKG